MKSRLFLALAMSALFSSPAFADGVGAMGGLSVSNSDISNGSLSLGLDSATGFTGGITSEFSIASDWLFFQPELIYIKKGAEIGSGAASAGIDFNELELPLSFKAKFMTDQVNPYFMFGPSVGYVMSSAASVVINGVRQRESINNPKDFEFSLHFGAGAETALTDSITGFFDVRYVHGLTNLSEDPGEGNSWKNRTWLFLLGARFGV